MKSTRSFLLLVIFVCLTLLLPALPSPAQTAKQTAADPQTKVCADCICKHMEYLAGDGLRGRGSATEDEHKAALYIASQLKAYGIEPAGDDGGYIQLVTLRRGKIVQPPKLQFPAQSAGVSTGIEWIHGKEMVVTRLSQPNVSGPLVKMTAATQSIAPGSVVFIGSDDNPRKAIIAAIVQGAAGVLVAEYPSVKQRWNEIAARLPEIELEIEGVNTGASLGLGSGFVAVLTAPAAAVLQQTPEGTAIHLSAATSPPEISHTWNAVGKVEGTDPTLRHSAVLFSAHLDHLGIGKAVNGDDIYNGADDDASGTVAVLELARLLGKGPKPMRTVVFALFGSEELGGLGSTYFREHPPIPLQDFSANLEFEMIGRPDAAMKADGLWLTGWERSNLGPALAQHGALLVGDPHPDENFFARSDNYVLAKKGVVAQTISSYGLHKDYHHPSDDVAHIDFRHMDEAIGSLLGAVHWLVDSDFKPQWNPGGKP